MNAVSRFSAMRLAAVALAFAFVRADAAIDIYFLRHGETSWNRGKVLQGSISHPDLTWKGVRMAEETAKGLAAAGIAFGRIYTSPYRRAAHTAEILAGRDGPRPIMDSRLREMCFGKYEGVRYEKGSYPDDNFRRFFEDPERYVPSGEGAESFSDVGRRLRDFVDRELKPLDGRMDRVLCVAHSLLLKTLVREYAGEGAAASAKRTLQRNCCVHVLRYEDGRFTLKETGRVFYSPEQFDSMDEPKMVAHRGAGDLTMPEASLPAYSNAVATGCGIVKLDLQFTKDGVVVMGHDGTLKRNMGWNRAIHDLTYAEIYEKGRFLRADGSRGEERIVRLDQALSIVKVIPELWIDFKVSQDFSPEFAEKVVAAISEAGIDLSRVMIATFTRPALAYFRERHPEIRRVGHFNFKERAGDSRAIMEMALRFRDEYGLYGLNMPILKRQTSPEDVAFLRKNGLWVSLWFVQDASAADCYRSAGADAFVTDNVSTVRAALRSIGSDPR